MLIDTRLFCPAFHLIGGMARLPGCLVCISDYSLYILRCIDLFVLIGPFAVCTFKFKEKIKLVIHFTDFPVFYTSGITLRLLICGQPGLSLGIILASLAGILLGCFTRCSDLFLL